jgi:hypothetical protein
MHCHDNIIYQRPSIQIAAHRPRIAQNLLLFANGAEAVLTDCQFEI